MSALPQGTITRDMPALTLRAAVVPSSLNREERTVEVMWSTGARVRRGFWEPFDEELSMDPKHIRMERLKSGKAPVLDSHDQWQGTEGVRGVVVNARIESGQGFSKLRFAKAEHDPAAERMFGKIADGIITGVSVGYRVHKMILVEAGDRTAGVVPVYRAVDWEPYELSPCGVGAELAAGFRSGPSPTDTNRCEFVSRSEESEMSTSPAATPVVPAVVPAVPAPATTPAATTPAPTDLASARAEGARTERDRIEGIRAAVRKAKLPEAFAAELLGRAESVSLDAARGLILDKLAGEDEQTRTDPVIPSVTVGDTDDDKFRRVALAYIVQRTGLSQMFRDAAKIDREAGVTSKRFELDLDAGPLRGMNLRELARHSLERRGAKIPVGIEAMVGTALSKRFGANSTSDFPVLMEDALNKIVLAAYATQADKWRAFCKVGATGDFKPSPRYRVGSLSRLDPVGQGGEFKHKDVPDGAKSTVQVATFGNIVALTRQAIINDDLGVFDSLGVQLGRAAKLTIELDVFETLLLNSGMGPAMDDGITLFHADHNNVGTGGALSVASVDADRVAMLGQEDISGNEMLEIEPAILLVPAGLGGLARVINGSQFDPTANAAQGRPNMVVGLYKQVIDTRRLSGTRRYSFADPSRAPVFEVSFLNGVEEPFLDQQEEFTVDGTKWKVRLDYGVDVTDFRGAVTNAGA